MLPLYLSGCNKLLVLMGPSYATRLCASPPASLEPVAYPWPPVLALLRTRLVATCSPWLTKALPVAARLPFRAAPLPQGV